MSEHLEVLFPGGKRVDVRVREFEIQTDQSVKGGGEASAPEPFDLFLSSMAACAGIYALNFCTSRDLSTEGLALSLDWDRDPANPLNASVRYQLRLPAGFPGQVPLQHPQVHRTVRRQETHPEPSQLRDPGGGVAANP